MPAMSSLRRTAVALALGGALAWASLEQEPAQALLEEDACAAGDEACSLSFRQLRGEQRTAEVEEHFRAPPPEEDVPAADASPATAAAAAAEESVPSKEEASSAAAAAKEESAPAAQEEAAEKPETKTTKKAKKAKKAKKVKAEDDEEEDDEGDEGDEGDEDDEDDEDDEGEWDEEEEVRGEFCCQFGQGKGATNLKDVGASCYPSAKPELYDFCDDKASCASDCNGTWVTGFCAFNATGGSEDPCALALNGYGTGYDYTGSPSRAVMNDTCATESACGGCNGTWCHYVKTPIY